MALHSSGPGDPGNLARLQPLSWEKGTGAILPGGFLPLGPVVAAQRIANEAKKPTNIDSARPAKKPTPAQIKEINNHLADGRLYERTLNDKSIAHHEYQKAVEKVIRYYGIDTKNVNGPIMVDKSIATGWETVRDRRIGFAPSAPSRRQSISFTTSNVEV